MSVGYYDTLLPVREPSAELQGVLAGIRLPYRVLASICVPGGRIVLAFISDSAMLSRMFATNWAPTGAGQEPDATLYALARPACDYGLDRRWDEARWWSRDRKTMTVFGFVSYRLAKVCVRGICSAVSGDDIVFVHGCALSVGAGAGRRGVVITGGSGAGKTTLVAGLLRRPEYLVAVLNDDWGAVSLSRGDLASTGERMLHMKQVSVLALCPASSGALRRPRTRPICQSKIGPPGCWCRRTASLGRHGADRRRRLSMWPLWYGNPRAGCRPAGQARRSRRWRAKRARVSSTITRRFSTDR
jgi:CobW/HypB/UreG, nucleotide-binding domain